MPTADQITDQISSLGGMAKFLGRKEIKELPNILWEDENVTGLVTGNLPGKMGTAVVVATNRRLLFVDKGMFGSLSVEDFPHDKITSIQYDTGMLLGTLTVFASGNKSEINNVDKDLVRIFAETVRAAISAPKDEPKTSETTEDIGIRLERLAKLKDQGILTEEEFQQQKTKILDSI